MIKVPLKLQFCVRIGLIDLPFYHSHILVVIVEGLVLYHSQVDYDFAVLLGKLKRVRQEVDYHLHESVLISVHLIIVGSLGVINLVKY